MTSTSQPIPGAQERVARELRALRVVPVITINDPAQAVSLATALVEGGLPCAEITFRTAGAGEALRRIRDAGVPLLAGAGTVLTPQQADAAREAGARFVVAPGLNPAVVEHCLGMGMPVFPGVCTPSEVERALALGLQTLKFFPAEAMGGVPFLKAISAPYHMVDWMPTGGVTPQNLASYLALGRVIACGGSWMATPDMIAKGEFTTIRGEAARAAALAGTSTTTTSTTSTEAGKA